MDLIQTSYDDRYYCILHFDGSLIDLGLFQGHRSFRKQQLLHELSRSFQLILMEFDLPLRLVDVMELIYNLFCLVHSIFKGENRTLYDFIEKNL